MVKTRLKRSISFPKLLFYGLGTMVGGGFYALLGKVAGEAQMATPLAFLLAGALALINAFTYGELASRFPFSAGEARYVQEAFGLKWLSALVGWLIVATGVVSAATLVVATIDFTHELMPLSRPLGIIILVLTMGGICIWGIGESVWTVLVITFIEVLALIYVIFAAGGNLQDLSEVSVQFESMTHGLSVIGIVSGAFLGFYAFIGFEDMANMAEEVKDAESSLPKAMLGSVVLTTLLYVLVSTVAVSSVSPDELATVATPLAKVVEHKGAAAKGFLAIASILTGINGALVQIIMASRVLYGLGSRKKAPRMFSQVNARTQTPISATVFASGIVLSLALFFPLVRLAETTSAIILVVFTLLNVSLIRVKIGRPQVPHGTRCYPLWVPVIGSVVCLGLLVFKAWAMLH